MKKNNKGLSLVELLVAITILAIIVAPMLRAFFVSARNNNKARNFLRATTVAQNLMEGIRAFSLEEICQEFNQTGEFRISLPLNPEDYMETGDSTGAMSGLVTTDGSGNTVYTFQGTASNQYGFAIKGLEEDGKKYDAKITLDASGYRLASADATDEEKANAKKTSYNDDYSFSVLAMNTLKDVVVVQDLEKAEKSAEEAYLKLKEGLEKGGNIVSLEDIKEKTVRRFVIIVHETDDNLYVEVRCRYMYDNQLDPIVYTQEYKGEIESMRNIYVMYYPDYRSKQDNILDVVSIQSTSVNTPVNIMLVKQKDTRYTNEQLDLLEKQYRAKVLIYDGNVDMDNAQEDGFISPVLLRTNINTNLAKEAGNKDLKDALQYEYHSIQNLPEYGLPDPYTFSQEEMQKILRFVDGQPQGLAGEVKNDNVLYDCKIEIFPEGTFDTGIRPDGTFDANVFQEENRLAVLDSHQ